MSVDNPRLNGNYWETAKKRENEKCVFCNLRDKYVVLKNENATLTVNIFPYIDGQLLIIPHRHLERIEELTKEEVLAIHELTNKGIELLKNELDINDVWVILRNGESAGKTIRHLHTNVMPYITGINTWHYQELKIASVDLAARLRGSSKNA